MNFFESSTIFLVHKGNPYYLRAVLAQARLTNPDSEIVLLGDTENSKNLSFFRRYQITHQFINNYIDKATKFEAIYHHSSKNSYPYEIFCFQRWFVILEYLESMGMGKRFVYIDSDALLYVNVDDIFPIIRSEMTVCNRVGPQYTFFKNPNALVRYCNFIESCFFSDREYIRLTNYVKQLNDSGVPHISDMATHGLYSIIENCEDIGLSSRNDYFFDENIKYSMGMKLGLFGKRIYQQNGKKYFQKEDGSLILIGGVHLQGDSKWLWPIYIDRKLILSTIGFGTFISLIYTAKTLLHNLKIKIDVSIKSLKV